MNGCATFFGGAVVIGISIALLFDKCCCETFYVSSIIGYILILAGIGGMVAYIIDRAGRIGRSVWGGICLAIAALITGVAVTDYVELLGYSFLAAFALAGICLIISAINYYGYSRSYTYSSSTTYGATMSRNDKINLAQSNILMGKRCADCTHCDDTYGDCPYEPNHRHQRPSCCHKYRERY